MCLTTAMDLNLGELYQKITDLENEIFQMKKDNESKTQETNEKILKLQKRFTDLDSPQEIYYQKILEKMFPGAGHRTLKTASGSSIITDVTTPDDWNPTEQEGVPSFHIEVKKTSGYKEILTQLLMAQTALPRDFLIGILFVNPTPKKLKDIFDLLHPHRIQLAYFDHHDQLWWFDGQNKKSFNRMFDKAEQYVEDFRYAQFLEEHVEKKVGSEVSTIELATMFMDWHKRLFGQNSLTYISPSKYTGPLEQVLKKNPWNVVKKKVTPKRIMAFDGVSLLKMP